MNASVSTMLGLLMSLMVLPAQAIDLVPLDVIPPPPGLSAVSLAYLSSHRGDLYREGERLELDSRLHLDQLQLRLGHAFELAGHPNYFYAQVANLRVRTSGDLGAIDDNGGLGDLGMMYAIWPYVDREAGRYVGIAAYLSLPTGQYDAERTRVLNTNPGENRVRGALQTGFSQRLLDRLDWLVAGDVAWFGDNDDYFGNSPEMGTLSQQPLYSAQTALSYQFNRMLALSLSYFYNAGGATRTEVTPWSNDLSVHRYGLVGYLNLPVGRLTLEYGGDLETKSGFFENHRWALRFAHFF